jgi:hypothetical protein
MIGCCDVSRRHTTPTCHEDPDRSQTRSLVANRCLTPARSNELIAASWSVRPVWDHCAGPPRHGTHVRIRLISAQYGQVKSVDDWPGLCKRHLVQAAKAGLRCRRVLQGQPRTWTSTTMRTNGHGGARPPRSRRTLSRTFRPPAAQGGHGRLENPKTASRRANLRLDRRCETAQLGRAGRRRHTSGPGRARTLRTMTTVATASNVGGGVEATRTGLRPKGPRPPWRTPTPPPGGPASGWTGPPGGPPEPHPGPRLVWELSSTAGHRRTDDLDGRHDPQHTTPGRTVSQRSCCRVEELRCQDLPEEGGAAGR